MADNSQSLHDLLMTQIHHAMANYCDAGMDESDAVGTMMQGLAGVVSETMATLAFSFRPDDKGGAAAFYSEFRNIVARMMEPEEKAVPAPQPVRQIMVETRAADDPLVIRTVH